MSQESGIDSEFIMALEEDGIFSEVLNTYFPKSYANTLKIH
jgi:hypothetical protein